MLWRLGESLFPDQGNRSVDIGTHYGLPAKWYGWQEHFSARLPEWGSMGKLSSSEQITSLAARQWRVCIYAAACHISIRSIPDESYGGCDRSKSGFHPTILAAFANVPAYGGG